MTEANQTQLSSDDVQEKEAETHNPVFLYESPDAVLAALAVDKEKVPVWEQAMLTPFKMISAFPCQGKLLNSSNFYYMLLKATEVLGTLGKDWGYEIVSQEILNGAFIKMYNDSEKIATVRLKVWHGDRENCFEQFGQAVFVGHVNDGAWGTDIDAFKKALTSALKKALSMLGISGDVYLGLYGQSEETEEAENPEEATTEPLASNSPKKSVIPRRNSSKGTQKTASPATDTELQTTAKTETVKQDAGNPVENPPTAPSATKESAVKNGDPAKEKIGETAYGTLVVNEEKMKDILRVISAVDSMEILDREEVRCRGFFSQITKDCADRIEKALKDRRIALQNEKFNTLLNCQADAVGPDGKPVAKQAAKPADEPAASSTNHEDPPF